VRRILVLLAVAALMMLMVSLSLLTASGQEAKDCEKLREQYEEKVAEGKTEDAQELQAEAEAAGCLGSVPDAKAGGVV